ncbi:uncharacterized protein LOC134206470 [Armigeres subalbatus]|uniref:uncharacterized protein LOC134206470 n=1 Tax=Armigeres subalbatus TaxID=124917 RepID=UPI002ED12123
MSGPIDLLLGVELVHEYLKNGRIFLGEGSPVLFETVFGWAVIGRWYGSTVPCSPVCHTAITQRNLEIILDKFWELEAVQPSPLYTAEENFCEELYITTTTRDSDGRYVVHLPKTNDPVICLGESRSIAEKRLFSLERRLQREDAAKAAYHEFMDEYLRLGHMRKIADTPNETLHHCYLPHHAVFKTTSTTTKTRVVFDASCRTASGYSLNDTLLVGPVVQDDLYP